MELEEPEVDQPAHAAEGHDGGDALERRRQRVAVDRALASVTSSVSEASLAGAMAATLSRTWTPMIISSQRRRQATFLGTSRSIGRPCEDNLVRCRAVALALRTSNTRTTLLLDLMVSRIMEI